MPAYSTNSGRFLYIAKQQDAALNEFKAGRTRQLASKRVASMGGQTDSKFKLLELFETKYELAAEARAHEILDAQGLRKYPGTRKELFVGSLDAIRAACKEGCRFADELYRLKGLDKVNAELAADAVFQGDSPTAKTKFWQAVLNTPIRHGYRTASVGVLIAAAERDPKALRRLENLGVLRMARAAGSTELKVVWQQADWLVQWLTANRIKVPRSAASVFEVFHAC